MPIKKIRHIAFIMDGNRRWARAHGLPRLVGHQKGYENLKTIADACFNRDIEVATFFAFSTENWNRSKREVAYLLRLLGNTLAAEVSALHKKNIKLCFIGDISGFPAATSQRMRDAMRLTERNTRATLVIATNYGGRAEILEAARSLIRSGVAPKDVTEERFSLATQTAGLPDPDFLIRTSGEQRLSGFLAWQTVYTELYFTKKRWPEFTARDLDLSLASYYERERRFGK